MRRGLVIISSFSYNQEYFVFYIVGQCNAAQLQAAHPPCHVFRLHGVEHITELIFLFGRILVGSGSDVFVQLLVVIVFYLFCLILHPMIITCPFESVFSSQELVI